MLLYDFQFSYDVHQHTEDISATLFLSIFFPFIIIITPLVLPLQIPSTSAPQTTEVDTSEGAPSSFKSQIELGCEGIGFVSMSPCGVMSMSPCGVISMSPCGLVIRNLPSFIT